jgi:hypothetical protein
MFKAIVKRIMSWFGCAIVRDSTIETMRTEIRRLTRAEDVAWSIRVFQAVFELHRRIDALTDEKERLERYGKASRAA